MLSLSFAHHFDSQDLRLNGTFSIKILSEKALSLEFHPFTIFLQFCSLQLFPIRFYRFISPIKIACKFIFVNRFHSNVISLFFHSIFRLLLLQWSVFVYVCVGCTLRKKAAENVRNSWRLVSGVCIKYSFELKKKVSKSKNKTKTERRRNSGSSKWNQRISWKNTQKSTDTHNIVCDGHNGSNKTFSLQSWFSVLWTACSTISNTVEIAAKPLNLISLWWCCCSCKTRKRRKKQTEKSDKFRRRDQKRERKLINFIRCVLCSFNLTAIGSIFGCENVESTDGGEYIGEWWLNWWRRRGGGQQWQCCWHWRWRYFNGAGKWPAHTVRTPAFYVQSFGSFSKLLQWCEFHAKFDRPTETWSVLFTKIRKQHDHPIVIVDYWIWFLV